MQVIDLGAGVRPQGAGIAVPTKVEKRWGHELIMINGEATGTDKLNSYCMKSIFIRYNNCTSMHFHVNKHETLFVATGVLYIRFVDGCSGNTREIKVDTGNAFVIPPGFMHQLCAWDGDLLLVEASTPDDPNDSMRVSL